MELGVEPEERGSAVLGLQNDSRCPYTLGDGWDKKCPCDGGDCANPYLDMVTWTQSWCGQKGMPLWILEKLRKGEDILQNYLRK